MAETKDEVPEWLRGLAESVSSRLVPAVAGGAETPVACHTNFAEGVWEITLFLDRTEVVGGAADGTHRTTPFFLDLLGLTDLFESVDRFSWQPIPMGDADDLGAHVAVEGTIEGRTVWLRVLSEVPRYFGGGRFSHLYEG